jgi:hypothetical protein
VGRVDQVGRRAPVAGHLDQTLAVGRGLRPDDQDDVTGVGEFLHRVLTVLRRVADVVLLGLVQQWEALTQPVDHGAGLVHRQGGLGDVGHVGVVGVVERVDVVGGLDQTDRPGCLPHRADDLLVAFVADQHDVHLVARVATRLVVDLRHERTGGVHQHVTEPLGVLERLGRRPVGGEHDHRARRHLGLVLDEHRALAPQRLDDVGVVDDLVADVDRRAEGFEGLLDDQDGTVDAGAESARGGEQERGCRHDTSVSARPCPVVGPRWHTVGRPGRATGPRHATR